MQFKEDRIAINRIVRYVDNVVHFESGAMAREAFALSPQQLVLTLPFDINDLMKGVSAEIIHGLIEDFKAAVVILGCNQEISNFMPLRANLEANKIGLEVMTPESACRTSQALFSEGREALLILFP